MAYLELLVNSRSEFALARCFNIPDRELGLSTFTDLKHEAQKKNMPMYQVIYYRTLCNEIKIIFFGGGGGLDIKFITFVESLKMNISFE